MLKPSELQRLFCVTNEHKVYLGFGLPTHLEIVCEMAQN